MRSHTIWVWCLTALLIGCEANVAKPKQQDSQQLTIDRKEGYVELRIATIISRVAVVKAATPLTYTVTEDSEDQAKYVSRTEHDCSAATSTLKYLAVYNKTTNEMIEDGDIDIVLDFEPGSLGQAELELACEKEGPNV